MAKRRILSFKDFMDNAKDYPTLTSWKKADDRWSKPINWKETNEQEKCKTTQKEN